jgi:hypothetical protein
LTVAEPEEAKPDVTEAKPEEVEPNEAGQNLRW